MKTKFNLIISDWKRIKNHCRTTVNKKFTDNEPSDKFKMDLIISEHSPLRLLEIDWSWENMKYWLSTEFSRHKFEKFISTQRNDRINIDRNKSPQDTLVKFDGYSNAQNLIDAWRKRLCNQAHKEAKEYALDFKHELYPFEPELSFGLVPNCVYRCGCPEFIECGFWSNFIKIAKEKNVNLTNIRDRYTLYNEIIKKDNYNE